MKGFRTIICNVIGAYLVPKIVAALQSVGITLTAEEQLALVAQIFTVGNVVLRKFTTTPLGGAVMDGKALYDLIVKEHNSRKEKTQMTNRKMLFPVAVLLGALCVMGALMGTGCATLANPTPSTQQVAAKIAVQYATGSFIQAGKSEAAQVARATEVTKVANALKGATGDESATIATLRGLALRKIADAGLSPPDRILANSLVDLAVTELTTRVKRTVVADDGTEVTVGVLSPQARVAVHTLLDWVLEAASLYAPAS
jgi:hypothetical protein